jgi:fatty-acyl-CoA synthase
MKVVLGLFIVAVSILIPLKWKLILGVYKLLKAIITLKWHLIAYRKKYFSYADFVENKVDHHPDVFQFMMAETGEKRTLRETDDLANRVAHWALEKGVKPHYSVGLMLPNCLDYFSIWYGISKIGANTALLNTNHTGQAFIHSATTALKNSELKILLVDNSLADKLETEIKQLLQDGIHVFFWGDVKFEKEIQDQSHQRPSKSYREAMKEDDPLIYIFTSGTTGLPKACKISHSRYYIASSLFPIFADLTPKDVVYTTLPLYHSAGGILGIGGGINAGCRVLIRTKFSASNFSKDCLKYKVTAVQYIGEICRYLVNSPKNEMDDQLKIRVAMGNGMRKDYWEAFQKRYHVQHVVEFYAATEGNVGLFNCFDKIGPIGYVPPLMDFFYPLKIVKIDEEDPSAPYRDEKGRCVQCANNEPGILINAISTGYRFEGYTDKKATNSKILRDVFTEGDAYFNTGDSLSRDAWGYFYWCDRLGDTFRWKGENVSTTEVSTVLSNCSCIEDNVVYPVEVPNSDGKAGMAAVVVKEGEELNFSEVEGELNKNLSAFAKPLFIRIKADRKLPVTSTHKYIKTDLMKEVSFSISFCFFVYFILSSFFCLRDLIFLKSERTRSTC